MALGILNNLSAIYAENNLNNTNVSLQTVLQQLSSGSRINSGADDAAGLSLVNGLAANSAALVQSATNATEGVGLLQVADGALSQVTNLLNRAVTLATEASNGTLNASQGAAANQEYQSILAEINNIGSTTTYNQQQVFSGKTVAIYTGDSSTAGSTIDALNIRTISQASVGDKNGAMSYGNGDGQNGSNVFLDLSLDGILATSSDSLGLATATTSIQVNYLQNGANGAVTPTSTTITVGAGTNYANSVQGLISAINNAGLGLTASFGTAQQAGSGAIATANASLSGGGSSADTGVIITGAGLGVGNNAGLVGSLTVGTALDPLSGTLNITGSDGASHALTLGLADLTDNIANLAATINAAGYGITAKVSAGTLTFTSASATASVSGANLTDTVLTAEGGASIVKATQTPLAGNVAGAIGTVVTAAGTDVLTGGILSITGQAGGTTTFTLGKAGTTDDLADLMKTINNWAAGGGAGAGITATLTSLNTITIASAGGGAGGVMTAVTLTGASSDSVASSPTNVAITGTPTVATPSSSTIGTLALGGGSVTDTLNGTVTIGAHTITLGGTGTTDTLQNLAKTINGADYGVTAIYNQNTKSIVFTSSNSALMVSYLASAGNGDQTTASATVAYTPTAPVSTAEDYYSVGISNAMVQDMNTQMLIGGVTTYGGTTNTGITMDINSAGQIATIGYTDGAGTSLVGTSLADQLSAQGALNLLNEAISDVAAMDGYIGAQINTLNSISQVMSTQQENVVSAQNAIQATDYAAATSNMSKYEILTQTGIAALAQANSIQQEVTKLLQ
ncbi:MAG TPA: flagellin [Terracidiphilus sp.]|nr:flagellin [Terracidiphilus sp.]